LVAPKSRGEARLKSANPADRALQQPRTAKAVRGFFARVKLNKKLRFAKHIANRRTGEPSKKMVPYSQRPFQVFQI